jgi:hypothetical protein
MSVVKIFKMYKIYKIDIDFPRYNILIYFHSLLTQYCERFTRQDSIYRMK